ncbi:hypothetical protein Y032_0614g680 [Ancylostoma ceylanicum]|nr:hypothetical protein Y032_0614g680 [Ancylostoma ceylanicum]
MDAITKDIQKCVVWRLSYADDIMLAAETKAELEQESIYRLMARNGSDHKQCTRNELELRLKNRTRQTPR